MALVTLRAVSSRLDSITALVASPEGHVHEACAEQRDAAVVHRKPLVSLEHHQGTVAVVTCVVVKADSWCEQSVTAQSSSSSMRTRLDAVDRGRRGGAMLEVFDVTLW